MLTPPILLHLSGPLRQLHNMLFRYVPEQIRHRSIAYLWRITSTNGNRTTATARQRYRIPGRLTSTPVVIVPLPRRRGGIAYAGIIVQRGILSAMAMLRQATDDLMPVCERSNTFSLFPSPELLPDATVAAPVLLFGRLSPTRRQEFPLSGRHPRAAQAGPEALSPDAWIDSHIRRVLREYRSALAADEVPNPWVV